MSLNYDEAVFELGLVVEQAKQLDSCVTQIVMTQENGEATGKVILGENSQFCTIDAGHNDIFTFGDDGMTVTTKFAMTTRQQTMKDGQVNFRFEGEAKSDEVINYGKGEDVVGFIALATQRIRSARSLDK